MASTPTPAHAISDSAGTMGAPQYLFPCSLGQQALWYLDRLHPGNPAWNIAVRFRIRGSLDLAILYRAINTIVQRHEVLRTAFTLVDAEPMQLIHDSAQIALPLTDLSGGNQLLRDSEEERITIEEAARRFDLKTGPLLRARVLKLADNEHMLLVTMHHIVSDGWSIGIFSDELAEHYSALRSRFEAQLPPLSLQYGDYAAWQSKLAADPSLSAERAYWKAQLADLPPCEIPPDFPRPSRGAHNGYILSELLPEDLTDALADIAARHQCTMFAACLAGLKALLAHHTRQQDIYIGSLLAGRDRVELEPLIGVFINTVILRTNLSQDPTFPELIRRVQSTTQQALANQKLHFQQVVREISSGRRPTRSVLYSVNFIYQRDFVHPREFGGLTMTPIPSKSPGAIYDLNFFMVRRTDGWRLSCEYDCELYRPETVSRLLGQLRSLFGQAAANPEIRLSEFAFAEDAGSPLPPFVPRLSGQATAQPASAPARSK